MTRIILITRETAAPIEYIDEARTPREVIKAVNTRKLLIGTRRPGMARQCAVFDFSLKAVVVREGMPVVLLWPCHYDILFCMVDGDNTDQIACKMGVCRRTIYQHIAEMKKRFNAQSRFQMATMALEKGLVCSLNPEN